MATQEQINWIEHRLSERNVDPTELRSVLSEVIAVLLFDDDDWMDFFLELKHEWEGRLS